jgi:hypothetical protein
MKMKQTLIDHDWEDISCFDYWISWNVLQQKQTLYAVQFYSNVKCILLILYTGDSLGTIYLLLIAYFM